jgi:hypothetical protein
MSTSDESDFTSLDDNALFSTREQVRAELERLPPHSAAHAALSARYDASLDELVERARRAWTRPDGEGYPMDDLTRARLLVGVDLLLTSPESLGNDALETDLYVLRDQLQEGTAT